MSYPLSLVFTFPCLPVLQPWKDVSADSHAPRPCSLFHSVPIGGGRQSQGRSKKPQPANRQSLVLVSSGFCNNKNLFPTVLRTEKSNTKKPAGSVSPHFWYTDGTFFSRCSHLVDLASGSPRPLFPPRAQIPLI